MKNQINYSKWKINNHLLSCFRFKWERQSTILGFSDTEFLWEIGPDTKLGTYRIRHFGYYRYILGGVYPYTGSTKTFIVE